MPSQPNFGYNSLEPNPWKVSMNLNRLNIAPCGLDCAQCDLCNLSHDSVAAQRTVKWFHDMGWLKAEEGIADILERKMYCTGCRGDRCVHWSADCSTLRCCVDDRKLTFCSQCSDFPCKPLKDWAATGEKYAQAFQRLEGMRGQ